jgi:hypothetical protein
MIVQAQRALRILRGSAEVLAGAASFNQPKLNLGGHRRITGMFAVTNGTAAAAGFPRIRQSADGITWSVVRVLAIDPTQLTAVVYPFDELILLPYVALEFTNGVAGTTLNVSAWALPE